MEAAFDADGRLLGIRGHMRHDHGANTPYGVALPYNAGDQHDRALCAAGLSTRRLALPDQFHARRADARRRPAARHVRDGAAARRIAEKLELAARRSAPPQSDPAEQMPYATQVAQRDGSTMIYDSGDYPECQRRALAAAGWSDFPARQDAARGAGPLHRHRSAQLRRGHRAGAVRERVAVASIRRAGSSSQPAPPRKGRASRPCWRRSCADLLGVPPDDIDVIDGDTAGTPLGLGAFASRQAVTAGNAVHVAAQRGARKGDHGRGRDARSVGRTIWN